jgi:hypothetical protein
VRVPGSGRVDGAGAHPTISAGTVSTACVKEGDPISAPNDHFTAGPDCGVTG